MCWTAYGTEIAATVSPEYRDQRRDTPRALLSGGLLTLAFLVLGPLATAGVVGEKEISAQRGAGAGRRRARLASARGLTAACRWVGH